MFRKYCVGASLLALAISASVANAKPTPKPDLILYHGAIFTADAAHPHAEAVAVRGDRIVAVGTDAAVRKLAGPKTRQVDLKGHTVIPGLNDAHAHLGVFPADEVFVELPSFDPAWSEVKDAITQNLAKAPKGAILAVTIGTTVFYDTTVDRAALDAVAPDTPVILSTFDGHGAVLNSAALSRAGLTDAVKDPAAGRYERDANGHLSGVLREYAATVDAPRLFGDKVSDADARAALAMQLKSALQYGITSIQDMPTDIGAERTVAVLKSLALPIRVRVTRMNPTTDHGRNATEALSVPAAPAPLITATGTKWVLDGVIFEGGLTPRSEGAAESQKAGSPYSFSGLQPLFPPAEVKAMLTEALHDNRQLQLHVFGRQAAAEALDAMEATGGAKVWAKRRLRFEHGDGLTPELIARARALGVVVSQQGNHMAIVGIEPKLGETFQAQLAADQAQPLKSLVKAGIPLALGSDGPLNPYMGIMFASLHPDRPAEAITREEAVTAYTLGSAYAEFAEKDKGSLAPGKLADIAVLSQDIFTVAPDALPGTTALLTLVGGKVAYESGELK